MISVENLKMEFGVRPLFEGVSFVVNDKERVCLVGRNGAGKSTMLKIIAGMITPTEGRVALGRGSRVGYLPQVMKLSDSRTVMEEVELAFGDVKALEAELERVRHELSVSTDYESAEYAGLIERAASIEERLEMGGTQNYKSRIERTLKGLGFVSTDFNRPTSEFSGGWRMRIELAKILLQSPDVLLLDEPTNHLDINSIQWLENFLARENRGSVMLVSHDRTFINNVTSRTLEIDCGKVVDYKVKYDDYVRLRAERREQQLRAYENQQREIASIEAFVDRFRYKSSKAIQVQSRIKQLEKMVPIEVDEVDNSALRLRFNSPMRSGDFPLICKSLGKSYGAHRVLNDVNLTVRRGEKVAFVGRNGEGKSTLVKCVMGEIDYDGELTIGHNVEIGYYAQNQAQLLNDDLTVFETIDNVATGDVRLKIRDILGAFMFGGEASDKKVGMLSGGERSRLAMIKLLLQPVNFLILDEPTNHLDMRTKGVLKEAIANFEGTVIVVSHDRDFLDGLVDKVYEFKGGQVREHLGGIVDFLAELRRSVSSETIVSPASVESPKSVEKTDNSEGQLSYEQQKELRRKRSRLEKQVADAEALIAKLEEDKAALEEQMATPEGASDVSLYEKHAELDRRLQTVMDDWEKAMTELENCQKEG